MRTRHGFELHSAQLVGRADVPASGFVFERCRFDLTEESSLSDFRRHGAAAWGRRHGEKSRHWSAEFRDTERFE